LIGLQIFIGLQGIVVLAHLGGVFYRIYNLHFIAADGLLHILSARLKLKYNQASSQLHFCQTSKKMCSSWNLSWQTAFVTL
jgi:hypothetical protein